jgi:hypothetical protein
MVLDATQIHKRRDMASFDASRVRQSVHRLVAESARLVEPFFAREPVLRGTVYELRRKCGKPRCVCVTEGRLHRSMVLSFAEDGRRGLMVVPADQLGAWRILTQRARELRLARARLVKVHAKILTLLDQLERARREEPWRRR